MSPPSDISGDPAVRFYDLEPAVASLQDAVLAGLNRASKRIPSKFLYDARGSELFEEICDLPEYYPTRTELGILKDHAGEMAELMGPGSQLVEFGSGASTKTRHLLNAMEAPAAYVAVDISKTALVEATKRIASDYDNLTTYAVCADFTKAFDLPLPYTEHELKPVGFFPGSTIGNFRPEEAVAFLRNARTLLGPGGDMIVGVDLKKDPAVLTAAYNDSKGVTAAFNLNLLVRTNRELAGTFEIERFRHVAEWEPDKGCIASYIESQEDQIVTVMGERFSLHKGERIHTEYSFKYDIAEFQALAAEAGFTPTTVWTDPKTYFSVHYLAG